MMTQIVAAAAMYGISTDFFIVSQHEQMHPATVTITIDRLYQLKQVSAESRRV